MPGLTKDNPARIERDLTIAQQRLKGLTYSMLATQHGLSKTTISAILTDPEIKDILNTGTQEIVKLIPKAVDNYNTILSCDDLSLRLKASKDVLTTVGIAPSNTVNQYFTNIINAGNINIGADVLGIIGRHIDGEILDISEDDQDEG